MSEKTEAPTPRRLRRAREEGDAPVSAALGSAVALLVVIALLPSAGAAATTTLAARLRTTLTSGQAASPATAAFDVLVLCAPLLLAGALSALAVGMLQSNGVLATGKLVPDLSRLDPIRGLRQLVSLPRLFALLRALVGAAVVAYLAGRLLVDEAASITHTLGVPEAGAATAGTLVQRLLIIAALVGLSLGLLDYLVVRHSWWRRLRMSRQEVKRDHRDADGDPELKAARKRAHQELMHQTLVAAVKEASVVVVNPTHLATALRYAEDTDAAPLVLAQGRGDLARQLIDAARAYGVPVIRDVPVARALSDLELGEEIPEALYEAVAEILRAAWTEQPPPAAPTAEAGGPMTTPANHLRTRA